MLQATLDGGAFGFGDDGEPTRVIVKSQKIPSELAAETQKVIDSYFPELCGVLLYYTGTSYGKYLGDWKIALSPDLLKKPIRKLYHTIAHELTHLIQYQQDKIKERAIQTEYAYLYTQRIPKGEESCEIWTYARHPDLVAPSSYLYFKPRTLKDALRDITFEDEFRIAEKYCNEIHELAKHAIEMRGRGERRYIKWFLGKLAEII
jgi:hypothetical protein